MIRMSALAFLVSLPACVATPYDYGYYTPRASVYVAPPPVYVGPPVYGPRVYGPRYRYFGRAPHYYHYYHYGRGHHHRR